MLQNLLIRNIAIADNIDIDWQPGMTSISGETGAGKSILLNSLNLALGDRAESNIVRHGEKRAEVVASFNIERIPMAAKWLLERDLDNGVECILRRIVSSDGRSRAFINGQPVPLAELKTLGEFLIDIHSQHAHQSLMRTDTHLRMLDEYAGLGAKTAQVKDAWVSWQGLDRKLKQLVQNTAEKNARLQLLQYQCDELDELDLQEGEVEQLEADFKRIDKSTVLLAGAHSALAKLSDDGDIDLTRELKSALHLLQGLNDSSTHLSNALSLLDSALIQIEESSHDLNSYIDSFVVDDETRFQIEERLNQIHELARKHRVNSPELVGHQQTLLAELVELKNDDELLIKLATGLSKLRKKKACTFAEEVVEKLNQLAMPGAKFSLQFNPEGRASSVGIDQVEYLISLNPGQPLQPLTKVASGGELSRVSLAIQVVCAEHSTIPTLVFDEVDVGISGATAEIVGHMLRSVGARGQVICVTHLPQVASLGHNHCIVQKVQGVETTSTHIHQLKADQRIDEIARMLGGIDITAQTRAHAAEMLQSHLHAH
jgi:DNA repair protein RecN (Recombination protein N)